ncbi:MAG: hypothetical protein HFI10_16315 [Lachnospiraceae bacterium]|jgi:hypothetical protein|nr:hypothetical protein [Lachnospiraceae bacterium]
MNAELKAEDSLLLELKEAEKVNMSENGITYSSVTYDYGGLLSIICC